METDKNPYLKSWLDGKIKEASTPEGTDAREILEDLQKEEYTSEELASWNDRLNNEAVEKDLDDYFIPKDYLGTEFYQVVLNRKKIPVKRPVREDKTGRTSTRPSDGNGVRGNSGAVQSNVLKDTQPADKKDKAPRSSISHESVGHNFHITAESGIGEGGLKTKFQQNIEAIKLLKQIEAEGRMATPSEQAILAKFNGWGTIASVFSDNQSWQKEQEQLKELLTPEEYSAARAAMTKAFYTSPEIAEKI